MQDRMRDTDMSQLEQEFELEMKDLLEQGGGRNDDREYNRYASQETGDIEQEFEMLFEADNPDAYNEYEEGDDSELSPYAERMYELSQQRYESEAEADEQVNRLLTEMEYEYFWNPLKKLKKAAKGLAKSAMSGPLSGLIKKGIQLAGKNLPIFQALDGVTKLARGDLKGLVGQLVKAGIGSAIPGAGPFLPMALQTLGFEASDDPSDNREAWNNIDAVARNAYEYLAENIHEEVDNPIEASRLASAAFQNGLRQVQTAGAGLAGRYASGLANAGLSSALSAAGLSGGSDTQRRSDAQRRKRNVKVVTLYPGDELVIRVRRG